MPQAPHACWPESFVEGDSSTRIVATCSCEGNSDQYPGCAISIQATDTSFHRFKSTTPSMQEQSDSFASTYYMYRILRQNHNTLAAMSTIAVSDLSHCNIKQKNFRPNSFLRSERRYYSTHLAYWRPKGQNSL